MSSALVPAQHERSAGVCVEIPGMLKSSVHIPRPPGSLPSKVRSSPLHRGCWHRLRRFLLGQSRLLHSRQSQSPGAMTAVFVKRKPITFLRILPSGLIKKLQGDWSPPISEYRSFDDNCM